MHLSSAPLCDSLNYSHAGIPTSNIFAGLDQRSNSGGFQPPFNFAAWNNETTIRSQSNFPVDRVQHSPDRAAAYYNQLQSADTLLSSATPELPSIADRSLLGEDPNARLVNCKQWLRMMKRRVRKELEKVKSADC
jgi:hypothetical protein